MFNNLTLDGVANFTVTNGNLTIAAGKTLICGSGAVKVSGDWTNNGTFIAGDGTVELNGKRISKSTISNADSPILYYDYFYDDFDDMTAGEYLVLNDDSGYWTTWDNAPGTATDAFVSDEQSIKSFKFC